MKITFNLPRALRGVPHVGHPALPMLLSTALLLCACDEASSKPKDVVDAGARRELLAHLASEVIAKTYAEFASSANTLADAASSYATSQSADDRARTQDAFKSAMRLWQRAEVFQVGPAARGTNNLGSQNLRAQIYAWPDADLCGIDGVLVDQSYKDAKSFVADSYPNVRGLAALERVLFDDTNKTACPSSNPIVKDGTWEALVKGDLATRRATFAKVLSDDVKAQAAALAKAFSVFKKELETAGNGSKLFATSQDGLNAVTNALFYVDTETKDMKLASPLNLNMVCSGDVCPDKLELAPSRLSKDAIIANLEAFRDAFRGLPPAGKAASELWGIADLLTSLSQEAQVKEMNTLIDKALDETNKIEPSLEAAIAGDTTQAKKAYMAIQDMTKVFKTELVSALSLKLPMNAASDND